MAFGEASLNYHLACWKEHMADPAVTEIVVNKPFEYGVEAGGKWTWYAAPHLSFEKLDGIGKLAAGLTRQTLDIHNPRASSILPGRIRIQIARPPAVLEETYSLCIRKRATDFTPTLEWLAAKGYFDYLPPRDWVRWWREAVHSRKTIFIVGKTGSSKTTFGEGLILEIPLDERLVTIEKTPEWNLPHKNLVTSLYGAAGDGEAAEHAATQCVEDALRQRPDRILVGELRSGGEAWACIRALMAGHPGLITTLHAASAPKTVDTLATIMRQSKYGSTMDRSDMHEQIKGCIDIIAHCDKDPYRVTEVMELH
jgi:type IV secretion system protein VirB11